MENMASRMDAFKRHVTQRGFRKRMVGPTGTRTLLEKRKILMDTPATTPDGIPVHSIPGIGIVILASEHNAKMTEAYLEIHLLRQRIEEMPKDILEAEKIKAEYERWRREWACMVKLEHPEDEIRLNRGKAVKIETPRTDAVHWGCWLDYVALCRELERENIKNTAIIAELRKRFDVLPRGCGSHILADEMVKVRKMREVLQIARDAIRHDLENRGSMSDLTRTASVAIENILSNTQGEAQPPAK